MNERAARVAIWLDQNFLMGEEMTADEKGQLSVAFTSLRNKDQELHIDMQAVFTMM